MPAVTMPSEAPRTFTIENHSELWGRYELIQARVKRRRSDEDERKMPASPGLSEATPRKEPRKDPQISRKHPHGTDWSASNLDRVSVASSVADTEGGTTHLRRTYPTAKFYSMICSGSSGGFSGTKDLVECEGAYTDTNTTLQDSARNALNSMLMERKGPLLTDGLSNQVIQCRKFRSGFTNRHFFTAGIRFLPELDFFAVGSCLLSDRLAESAGAVKFPNPAKGNALQWGLPTQEEARIFVLTSVILTMGSSDYYLGLHRMYRNRFLNYCTTLKQQAEHMQATQRQRCIERAQQMMEAPRFVVAVRGSGKKAPEHPHFWFIGKNVPPFASRRDAKLPHIQHDFCIAVPDVIYCNSSPAARKKLGKGAGTYIRPKHSATCLLLEEEPAAAAATFRKPPSYPL